jgi:hypothetical protein
LNPLRSDGSWDCQAEGWISLEAAKAHKTKLAKGGPSGLSPVRSDGPRDNHAGGIVRGGQCCYRKSWKTTLETKGPIRKTGIVTA